MQTLTSEADGATEFYVSEEDDRPSGRKESFRSKEAEAKKRARILKEKAKRELDLAEEKGEHMWDIAKEQLLRPGVAGGLMGLGELFNQLILHPPERG